MLRIPLAAENELDNCVQNPIVVVGPFQLACWKHEPESGNGEEDAGNDKSKMLHMIIKKLFEIFFMENFLIAHSF